MSDCVVRMEMPKSCRSCPLCSFVGSSPVCAIRIYPLDTVSQYYYADKKPSNCPILCQLPEGHGRLGDLDALIELMLERKKPLLGADSSKDRYRYMQWLADFNAIKDAKTIVPATERSETEQV